MGEDRDIMQEELESKSSTNSDGEEESEEVESEHEGDSVFVVLPHGTMATGTAKGSGTSFSTSEGRKPAADKDAAQAKEAKRARVEHHLEGLQGSPPPVVNAERREDETGARAQLVLCLEAAGAAAPSSGQEGAPQGSSTGVPVEAPHRPVGDRQDQFLP
jgi:hypothetical protein